VSAERPVLLIVDDEARILSALRRTLRREGYEILTADTAAEALRRLDETPVDAVLSDHKMPGMSGDQLLDEVARRWPRAVRMLITGWTRELAPQRLEQLGVSALITKPWDDAKLKATLRRALSREPAEERSPSA
jgi:response regulator RpfG family c-di-GMP phosphodiesterase